MDIGLSTAVGRAVEGTGAAPGAARSAERGVLRRLQRTEGSVPVPETTVSGERLQIRLLGGLRVTAGDRVIGPRQLGGAKARQVLIALLLSAGTPVSKERLRVLLWGDTPPSGATGTLETYVSVLRKSLQPSAPVGRSVVQTVSGGYALDMRQVDLDTVALHAHLADARRAADPAMALSSYDAAMTLAHEPLLPEECGLAWVDDARAEHDRHVVGALVDASTSALRAHSPVRAEHWSRAAIARDPLNEPAWAALLESFESRGQFVEGVRAYTDCRRILADELGCPPGPVLRRTFARLLAEPRPWAGDDLGDLLESVIRLHRVATADVSQPERRRTVSAGVAPAPVEQLVSSAVQEAYRTLTDLLQHVGGSAFAATAIPA